MARYERKTQDNFILQKKENRFSNWEDLKNYGEDLGEARSNRDYYRETQAGEFRVKRIVIKLQ